MSASMKNYVLSIKKKLDDLKKNDSKVKQLYQIYTINKKEYDDVINDQKELNELYPDDEDPEKLALMKGINLNIESLHKTNNDNKTALINYLIKQDRGLKTFNQERPELFSGMLFEMYSTEVLCHVLDTYTMFEKGQISEEQGKEMGYNKFHKK